ncbi:MAG: phosphatidate cytidylyltransferase [Thermomicrobiales bacterium]
MRQRSISALGVAVVGIVPALLGGPVWAIVFAALCTVGMVEYLAMARRISAGVRNVGLLFVPLFATVAWFDCPEFAVLGFATLAVFAPLFETTLRKRLDGALVDWALQAAGTLYLGLPVYAAIALRRRPGEVDAGWLSDLAEDLAFGWDAFPRGLAWLVSIILITWMSDTFAYLVGRQIGTHKFSPVVSPNKSLEGVGAGVVAAAITGALTFTVLGIDDSLWIGLSSGAVLSLTGLFGDLGESVIKRQAGVKDSGAIIPGHGGMLDRLDALLVNFVAGLYIALVVDHFVL